MKTERKIELLAPETAPKDGTQILADFGWPWLMPAAWCHCDERWAVATFQGSVSAEFPDRLHDLWWETDQENHKDMKGWIPFPQMY